MGNAGTVGVSMDCFFEVMPSNWCVVWGDNVDYLVVFREDGSVSSYCCE